MQGCSRCCAAAAAALLLLLLRCAAAVLCWLRWLLLCCRGAVLMIIIIIIIVIIIIIIMFFALFPNPPETRIIRGAAARAVRSTRSRADPTSVKPVNLGLWKPGAATCKRRRHVSRGQG